MVHRFITRPTLENEDSIVLTVAEAGSPPTPTPLPRPDQDLRRDIDPEISQITEVREPNVGLKVFKVSCRNSVGGEVISKARLNFPESSNFKNVFAAVR